MQEATLEDLAKEFGKNAAEELHRRVYREDTWYKECLFDIREARHGFAPRAKHRQTCAPREHARSAHQVRRGRMGKFDAGLFAAVNQGPGLSHVDAL